MEECRLTIEIDPQLKKEFKSKAAFDGFDMKSKLEQMINLYLEDTPTV